MNNLGLVTFSGIKNVFRMKIVAAIMIPVMLICIIGVALLLCLLLIAPEVKSATPDRDLLEGYLGLALYASSIIAIGVTLNSMLFQIMVREKSRGNLEALLATPLRVIDIWVGKSLALFIPGLVLCILLTVLSWIVINMVYFLPDIGLVINAQMFVNSLIAVPLMYLFFGMLVYMIGLVTKPQTGNIIAQIFLPLMANLAAQLVARGVMNANSWQFMVMNFGIAFVIGFTVLIIRPRLIKERIILSG